MGIRRIHVLIGVVIALPLCLQAFTGALLVFERETDTWLNRDLFYVEPTGTRLSPQEQFDAFVAEYPEMATPAYIMTLPVEPDHATLVLAKPYNEVGPRRGVRFFIDPYTGDVLGNQPYHSTLMGKLYDFHRTFWLPRWGRWVTSTSALLTASLVISGLVLYWTTRRNTTEAAETTWLLRVHRRTGKYFGPLVFVLALNGAAITYMFLVLPMVYRVSGTEMPRAMREGRSTSAPNPENLPRVSLDDLITRANQEFPDAQPRVLLQPGREETAVTVILKKKHELRDAGGTFVAMHPYTGEPMGVTDFTDGELGHRATYWIIHSHKGTWGGYFGGSSGKLASRVLWIVTALAATIIAATGGISWARRAKVAK